MSERRGLAALDLPEVGERATRAARSAGIGETIEDVRRFSGGISSASFMATMTTADGARGDVVLKIAPPGLAPVGNRDVLRQADLLEALAPHFPVPAVLFRDRGAPPEVPPMFAMELLPGECVDPAWPTHGQVPCELVDARTRRLAAALGRLHAVDPAVAPDLPSVAPVDELEMWRAAFATVDESLAAGSSDVVEALRSAPPSTEAPVIAHGDYHAGNALFEGPELVGVIDWELASRSDARADLEYFLLHSGATPSPALGPVRGAPDREELIELYCSATDRAVPLDLTWFSAAARFKVAAALAVIVKQRRRRDPDDRLASEAAVRVPQLLGEALDIAEGR